MRSFVLQGGFTPIDVFAVKWIQAGVTHFGLTASYYGFVADGKFSFFWMSNFDVVYSLRLKFLFVLAFLNT